MDLLRARVTFRERTLLDAIDLSIRFVAAHGKSYAKLSAIVLTPIFALCVLLADIDELTWWFVVTPALAVLAQTPFTILASRFAFTDAVPVSDVLRDTVRSMPRVVLLRLSAAIAIGALSFMIVPGIWIAVGFMFGTEVLLLERSGPFASLKRAYRMSMVSFGDTMQVLILLAALYVGVVVAFRFGAHVILEELLQLPDVRLSWPLGERMIWTAGVLAYVPFHATARFFVYLNVRTRNDGWDVQARFSALAARSKVDA